MLTAAEADEIALSVGKVIIEKGTRLYRTSGIVMSAPLVPRHDPDTGKMGLYFSDGKFIPLGMIPEWKKPRYLCTCVVTENIEVLLGKYSFRELEAARYYTSMENYKNGEFVFNVTPRKSLSSIDNSLFPIVDIFEDNIELWQNTREYESEVFIGKDDLHHIKVEKCEMYSVETARRVLNERVHEMKIQRIIEEARIKH
jgi:hypothetical protein